MADPEKATGPPESPTTRPELDFDDDDVDAVSPKPLAKSGGAAAGGASASDSGTTAGGIPHRSTSEALAPPAQPPRPVDPREQAENTLKEAFPGIEASVIKAVLVASGGQIEPAFNALLGMSDPDAQHHEEPAPPPQPPRPVAAARAPQTQLEQDELYARQLAEHYNNQYSSREYSRREGQRGARPPPRRSEEDIEKESSFLENEDFVAIREGIKKGFVETQSKVNSFITNLRKRIDGEDEDEEPPPQPPRRPLQQFGGSGRRTGDVGRRSGDRDRYDADPEVLGDDFAELQLRDDELPPRRPGGSRPAANPDLFKPTPARPQSGSSNGGGRRVSFQDGPPEEISTSNPRSSPRPPPSSATKSSKWQPLATVDPSPVADHDDPFSLGDSDDEDGKKDGKSSKEAAGESGGAGADAAAAERLKKATAEAMGEELGGASAAKE